MKKYNVLWIDDEPEKQDAFIEDAFLEGINLVSFTVNKTGMDELKNEIDSYDAIILDAKGFEESKDERPSLTGLMNSIKIINSLSVRKPYFIFSAYLDKDEYGSARELLKNEDILTKGIDNQKLFSQIKEAADKQVDTQIRHENQALFEALESYGADDKKTILEILKAVKNGSSELSDHLYFTSIRVVLERMFRKANEIGLLHDVCVNVKGGKVNLRESSKFLAGEDCDLLNVRCSKTHFPKLIANSVKNILFITGAASHTSEVDVTKNIDVQSFRSEIKSPYLLLSLFFQLADVLIWFHQYGSCNLEKTENKGYWENIEYDSDDKKWMIGEFVKIASNGWGTVLVDRSSKSVGVFKGTVEQEGFVKGDKVKLTIEENSKAKSIQRI